MTVQICVNVINVGAYKLNRIASIFGISSDTVNTFLKIPLLKYIVARWLDYNEYLNMRRIKAIAKKHNCPITWSVTPFRCGLHTKIQGIKHAFPEAYKFIKKFPEDEVIQEGCQNSADEFRGMPETEQHQRMSSGFDALKNTFPNTKKIMQVPKWRADQNTIKILEALSYEGVLGSNLLDVSVKPLKTTYQVILNKVPFNKDFFAANVPINLVVRVNDKGAISELETWLKFIELTEDFEFILCSEALL